MSSKTNFSLSDFDYDKEKIGQRAMGTRSQLMTSSRILIAGAPRAYHLFRILRDLGPNAATKEDIILFTGLLEILHAVDFVIVFHDFIPNSQVCQNLVLEALRLNVPCIVVSNKHGGVIDRSVVTK